MKFKSYNKTIKRGYYDIIKLLTICNKLIYQLPSLSDPRKPKTKILPLREYSN